MAGLDIDRVNKRFNDCLAVDDVSIDVRDGEFLAILGPSGCGKTTLLRMIAGFEKVSGGTIRIDGETVSAPSLHVPAESRNVGIVFQSYALWPHMTVGDNVGYALRVRGIKGEAYKRRVAAALRMVSLDDHAARYPAELSGGQRQRVALARCMAMEPSLVLLDEPLANLDVHLRASMEDEFARFHTESGATMVYITHDQAEAMALADRVAVMNAGRLEQVAAPRTLYGEPATEMVARFIGQGSVVPAEAVEPVNGNACRVRLFGKEAVVRTGKRPAGGAVKVSLRPEHLVLNGGSGIPGRVTRAVYKGGVTALTIASESDPEAVFRLSVADSVAPRTGDRVSVAVRDGWVLPS